MSPLPIRTARVSSKKHRGHLILNFYEKHQDGWTTYSSSLTILPASKQHQIWCFQGVGIQKISSSQCFLHTETKLETKVQNEKPAQIRNILRIKQKPPPTRTLSLPHSSQKKKKKNLKSLLSDLFNYGKFFFFREIFYSNISGFEWSRLV